MSEALPPVATIDDIRAAAARIAPLAVRTPLLRNDALDAAAGARVFVKAECLQRHGAFKIRGAMNALAALGEDARANGVIAFSSGNHAIAVAAAARHFAVRATIVMPADAPRAKLERTRGLGAEVVTYDRVRENREAIGQAIAAARKLPLIKPFDDPLVMAGQGTVGLEIADDLAGLGLSAEVALVPASGGGLASGVAIALGPATRVWAVEPEGHDDLARSLAGGAIVANAPGIRSICDALMVEKTGAFTFSAAQAHLAGAFAVSDASVRRAMRFAFDELKLVLEPGGAIALAAALERRLGARDGVIAVVASGGNVDAETFAAVLA